MLYFYVGGIYTPFFIGRYCYEIFIGEAQSSVMEIRKKMLVVEVSFVSCGAAPSAVSDEVVR